MSIAALSSAPTPIMASNAPVTARMTEAASTTAIASNLPANAHASVDMLASRPRPGTFQSHSYRHTQANMQSQPQLQTVVLPAESQPQLLSLRHTAAGVPLQTDSLSTRMPQTSVLNVIPLSPRSSRARPRGLSASTKDRVSPAASDRSIDGMIDSKPSLADQTSNPTVISRSKSPLPSPRSSTRTPATISLASHLDQATNTVARSLSEVASNPQPNPGGDRDLKTAQVDHDQKHASLMGKVRHRKSSASSQIGLVINSTTASSAHLGGKQVSSPVDISAPVKLRRRLSDPAQSLQDLASTRQGHRARSSSQGQGYYSQDENIANDVDDLDDGSAESSHEPDQPIRLASKASIKRAVKNLGIATEVIRLLSKRQNTPSAQMKLLSSQRRNSMQSIGPAKAFGIVAIMGEMAEETRSTTSTMSDIDRKEANSAMAEAEMIKRSIHRRWRVANAGIVLGLRFARIYKDTIKRFQDVKMAPVVETTGLSYMLRSHQGQGDTNLSAKVREVLDGNRERTKEAIEQLERTLSIRIRSFARFTLNQRLQFCEIMHYERFPKETLLVKEGHVSWAFYFILNGQVEIFKIKDKLKYRVCHHGVSCRAMQFHATGTERLFGIGSKLAGWLTNACWQRCSSTCSTLATVSETAR
ncbi:hypothetical protein BC831DRAFT_277028 [Entophlyctis helioformis]|nr:hypothetical protein BC831DRAFT_277028 [Entophlyctis helioformis]